ncbi:MAG: Jag N-terminal domain-containing protein [Desulfamplus sp.]|nr:Jag N-terminal domain-containing protein [Desulfamplus sp.]
MKQTQEFDGKNVDNAVEKACLSLNISKKNLVYDVISSGSTGIFGIVGVKKAKIRVTLPEKKDSGSYGGQYSSYESDRAGVMSIVDEAFGKEKEIKQQSANPPSSEQSLSEHNKSDGETISDEKMSTSDITTPSDTVSEISLADTKSQEYEKQPEARKPSERRKHSDNRKKHLSSDISETDTEKLTTDKLEGDKQVVSRPKKGRASGRKGGTGKVMPEKPLSDELGAEKITTNEVAAETSVTEKAEPRKQGKGKSGDRKPDTIKPYSRKSRTKKRDTWLQVDGDDALNEAMAAMDADETAIASKSAQTPRSETNKKGRYSKTPPSAENLNLDKHGDEDNIEPDDEFLNEDFHGGIEENGEGDDDPYIKDDDEIIEVFDERDDGYPPKYKGEIPVDVSEDAMRVGRDTLQKMVALITDDATVTAQSDEDRLLLKVEGGNSGVLIGRRGQTLEAMQYLTDKIINRYSESRVRLKVDIEGYMETRKANLKTLAYKMADKAKKTGKPATINQMTAQDRRIIHLALKDDTRVRTQSMGDGYYRRLVIFPKKSSFKRRKPIKKIA